MILLMSHLFGSVLKKINKKIDSTDFLNLCIKDADECEQCTKILEELENIDDDCDRHGITFVKTKDFSVAEQYGVHDYPALVYFEGGIPNVFEGKLIMN